MNISVAPSAAYKHRATMESAAHDDVELQVAQFVATLVEHTVLNDCLSQIHAMHSAARHHRGKARGMLIYGLTGTGKSTAAKEYEQRYPRSQASDRVLIPVLRVELPGHPTAKAIGEAILIALGDPLPHAGSAEFRMNRVRKLFKECQVELVILDEFQHITDNLNGRDRNIAADTIKNLMNDTGIPCVFIGTPSCRAYFVQNQQLGRRCSPKIGIRPFGFGTAADRTDFLRLLLALHHKLPFTGPSALIDPQTAEALHFASFGLVGLLIQLVECALRNTLLARATQLTREALHQAFAEVIYPRCPSNRNPFDKRFNCMPLTGPEEPFHGFGA
ncbi:TniB family NTP-binding protein [Ramlibacter sp.]|uniref:TniB family NTP-binding protein n=1 Tax=Ramlibacter sp. TaxID=1917967 RepID=UPI002BEF0C82|nr:TniB family NTP-binding protein [Ramlibacter sp.]HWI83488.1 TniB family NTP-binding protein [Ramlibacter sp.]